MLDAETRIDMELPVLGKVNNIPPSLLGWVFMAALLGFMVWKMVTSFEVKLEKMSAEMPKQTVILQQILEEHRK